MPPAPKLTVAKAEPLYRGRDHFWRVIRALGADGRCFTAAEVRGVCDEPQRGTIPTLLRRLERDGFVEACGERRSAAGKLELDDIQSSRQQMNDEILKNLRDAAEVWGLEITRSEITDVRVDEATKQAQRQQLNAERERRATVAKF